MVLNKQQEKTLTSWPPSYVADKLPSVAVLCTDRISGKYYKDNALKRRHDAEGQLQLQNWYKNLVKIKF